QKRPGVVCGQLLDAVVRASRHGVEERDERLRGCDPLTALGSDGLGSRVGQLLRDLLALLTELFGALQEVLGGLLVHRLSFPNFLRMTLPTFDSKPVASMYEAMCSAWSRKPQGVY